MKTKQATTPMLQSGQIWQMPDRNLRVQLVGNLMVHYRIFKGNAKRAASLLSAKRDVESYLKRNKAVLVQE